MADFQNKEGSTGRLVDNVFVPFESQDEADGVEATEEADAEAKAKTRKPAAKSE